MNKAVKFILLAVALGFVLTASGCGMTTAGPGEVGIKVNLVGDKRGVDEIPVDTGRIFYNPLTQRVFIYPTFMQTYTWTKAHDEGSPTDESVTFNSKEGLSVNADISMAFKLDPVKVPHLYATYRKPIDDIRNTYLRSIVRKAFVEVASTMSVDEIYGPKKAWLAQEVTKRLNRDLGPMGFMFDYVTFAGDLRLPENVMQSINLKIEATQKALQAQNELKQREAEAKAIKIKADAEAYANKVQVNSVGGPVNYIKLKQLEKLNPNVQVMMIPSGSMPLLDMSTYLKTK